MKEEKGKALPKRKKGYSSILLVQGGRKEALRPRRNKSATFRIEKG